MEYYPRIGEERELSRLRWLSEKQSGRMAVVSGRQGSGRTATLGRVLRGFPTIVFRIGGKTAALQMKEFIAETSAVLGKDNDWSADSPASLIGKIADFAKKDNINVVVEYSDRLEQYWRGEYSALDALWRRRARNTKMFLVLCGDSRKDLGNIYAYEDSPLFNAPDSTVDFGPLKIREFRNILVTSGFDAPASAILLAWAMTGGYIGPLSSLISGLKVASGPGEKDISALLEAYFRPSSPLVHGIGTMLTGLFGKEGDVYMSVLQAMAGGASSQKEIEGVLGLNVGGHLSKLETVYGLVTRERPAFADPARRGVVRYGIKDVDVEFWMRFVHCNAGPLAGGDYGTARARVAEGLEDWLDRAQVKFFRRKMEEESSWQHVGGWWKGNASMDIVAWSDDRKRIHVAKSYRAPEDFSQEDFRSAVNAFKIQSGKAGGLQASYLTREDILK